MRMTVRQVPKQAGTYQPFDWTVKGFTQEWWDREAFGGDDGAYEHFIFRLGGAEAVRVETEPGATLNPLYEGLDTNGTFVDIAFFEVREDLRRRGLGREAVEWLAGHYGGETLTAFSEESGEFWQSMGWTYHPRFDRQDQAPWHHNRPLFVSR